MAKITWKLIPGFDDKYQINSSGIIQSLVGHPKILKRRFNNKGYPIIALVKNKKQSRYLIHRLVALSFIPNPNNFPIVHHIDENPANCHVNNLEWTNQSSNLIKSSRIIGEKNRLSKISNLQAIMISCYMNHHTIEETMKTFKVSFHTCYKIKTGRTWSKITGVKRFTSNRLKEAS